MIISITNSNLIMKKIKLFLFKSEKKIKTTHMPKGKHVHDKIYINRLLSRSNNNISRSKTLVIAQYYCISRSFNSIRRNENNNNIIIINHTNTNNNNIIINNLLNNNNNIEANDNN